MLKPISEDFILTRMKYENPWWINGEIDSEYDSMKRRLYFNIFLPYVKELVPKRAVVLMGPRRVGKTVMMFHAISSLLGEKIDRQKIAFIGIDNPIYLGLGLEQLFLLSRKASGSSEPKGWYVFFDEIQYLKNWEVHLKVLVDSYPNTKFIVSGSAAAALKIKSNESGAGRFTEFMLPPLTFNEYIDLKGLGRLIQRIPNASVFKDYSSINLEEINKHFIDYINFGGYPEVIFSEKIQLNLNRYIKSDIVDKVLLRDLPSLYGIQDVQELNAFFTTLAYYSGNEVSIDTLSKNSGIDKNTLKKYLEYLQAAFLIKVVNRIDDTAKRFKRANFFKVYLTNPSLRSALFSPLQPTDDVIGNMVETAIYAQYMHQDWFTPFYARWNVGNSQGEVDIVSLDEKKLKPVWAMDVKWSNRYFERPEELKSLISFCKKNDLEKAFITSIDKKGIIVKDDIELHFFPASLVTYAIGDGTIETKAIVKGY